MSDFSVLDQGDREERIRQLAFQLWEADGRPEGKSEEYWFRAAKMIDETLTDSGFGSAMPLEDGSPPKSQQSLQTATEIERRMKRSGVRSI